MLLEFDCELELEVFLLLVCFGCGVPLLTLEVLPQAPKRRPSGKIAPTNHRDVFIAAPFLGTPIGHYDNRNCTLRLPLSLQFGSLSKARVPVSSQVPTGI